ncbi:MAG TPA: HlyD family efflux transporter periplasmic adaptor subunit [Ferruginibacter sp.]|nr:HlyD family efflux transporter periplasmic adaptor subunit [Ferruginibacter sp.]HNF02224.1 HlyD family efflux transporter periplasmic adaptor subunit [Ferruginibacter sp.]HNF44309.1 HlyD family efflux transporter periplasmic adaptor subunit [Ferruginibacter sp.]HNG62400.1 HlyD family efflux transporter periplasmic adaptor subunit [Ferruginibacter sp.]HNJ28684.1 HlyD family efflux transporter periplasmic adaptor subunit [Ferruginibacter sp.]
MKSVVKKLVPLAGIVLMASCGNGNGKSDASGTFEADEVIVSAEATGKILQLNVEEGAALAKDMVIGKIDPTAIELQKEQAASSVEALGQKTNDASPQVSVLESQIVLQQRQVAVDEEQLRVLQKEQQRFQKLVAADAVPAKQLDDINGQVDVLEEKIKAGKTQLSVLQSQVNAQRRQVAIQNRGILSEKDPMEKKVAIIEDQLNRTSIKNPLAGTVLTKYAQANEFTSTGKALYKIADLSVLKLRAYITGNQLAQVKLNQAVKVKVDDGKGGYREFSGTISWISDKAEFTPKTIQTKEERANLVYAVKINVKNDGYLKIGMYGEVLFN